MLCFYFLVLISSCQGQVSLLPNLVRANIFNAAQEFTLPVVQGLSRVSGDILTNAVDFLSNIQAPQPHIVNYKFPKIVSSNINDFSDSFISDYNNGLGNEDANLRIDKLIVKYGYQVEQHDVVTKDGYILSMFRIPGNGPVIFLMHGLLGSADDFVIAGSESGLAYLLANEGYDVWMGNVRGNKHSRLHKNLSPSDAAFWDFSWHEIGYYDQPAMIDYILESTNRTKLKYVGHSQGCTSFFVMVSKRPEYNDKVAFMAALSPVVFMKNAKSPFVRLMSPAAGFLHGVARSVGLYEVLPDNSLTRLVKRWTCGTGRLAEILCSNSLFVFTGVGIKQLNFTNLPVIFGHSPAGTSAKQLIHFSQSFLNGGFREFDYGTTENVERYGSAIPPRYHLERITIPVSLFYSDEDWMAHPDDVSTVHERLGNPLEMYRVPFHEFNHMDFLFAKDFKTLIFKPLKKLLSSY